MATFPIFFTEAESESINEVTAEITNKLEFLFRGTAEAPAVGNLAENISLPNS